LDGIGSNPDMRKLRTLYSRCVLGILVQRISSTSTKVLRSYRYVLIDHPYQ